MSLTNPEWSLKVENHTRTWEYETFPGDLNPPFGDVWLTADDFTLSWSFANDTSPGPLEAPTFSISLSCTTAADVPAIDYGDQILVTLTQPDGPLSRDPDTGIVSGDYGPDLVQKVFWVSDLTADDVAGRTLLRITATATIPDITLDVAAWLAARAADGDPTTDTWQSWAEWFRSVAPIYDESPYPHIAGVTLSQMSGAHPPNLPVNVIVGFNNDWNGHTAVGLKIGDEIGIRQLLDGIHALWLAPPGWDSRAHGCAFVWDTDSPGAGAPGSERSRSTISRPWDPEASLAAAAPFEITYVGSVLDSELLDGFTPAAADSTLAVLDACLVRSGPQWRKDITGAVGIAQYKGHTRVTTVPDDDTELTVQGFQTDGTGVRSIDSLAYLGNAVTPAIGFESSGSRAAADAAYLTDTGGNGWVPESLEVLPRLMTDSEWVALGRMFWPTDERQHTLILVNVDTADDLAGGPIWLTLIGCRFTIDDGHLVLAPTCRPFIPAAVNGITDPVTWTELDTAHAAATFAQAADRLTWSQAKVSSL